jgi:hypothetical protein
MLFVGEKKNPVPWQWHRELTVDNGQLELENVES